MGAVFWAASGWLSCLWPGLTRLKALPGSHVHLSQDGFQMEGFWGLAEHAVCWQPFLPDTRLMEYLLCTCVRLRNPLDLKNEELWSLCFPPSKCPVLLLVSYLGSVSRDWLQLFSLGSVCLLRY